MGKKGHRNRLTIDRKNSKLGYIVNNICLACEICNNRKGNLWTFRETFIMARRELTPLWKKLLYERTK